ncbi:MAG TPA: response regulator, partial [Verrucomicrobiota bacterium]|nr:response regulator [Verrucomicrobiota bacterium]
MDIEPRHKILLLDDDPALLEVYQDILSRLPSKPEIRTATSGHKAIAMLEDEPFRLLISDLKMPKMDGLQVLSIVRKKFPELRTVVLTSVLDEHFRSRVYALGVDLFWEKPATDEEVKLFSDCIESLLDRESTPGFRGVQNKSLVDIIQLECISQSSSVLRITNGPLTGKIWINDGELYDAQTDGLDGEAAFQKILSWKTGSFESLAAEPEHPRVIQQSYNALLLETAQALDELHGDPHGDAGLSRAATSKLAPLAQVEGVEFVLTAYAGEKGRVESRGLENTERIAAWTSQTLNRLRQLGERLQAGPLDQAVGLGP